MDPYDWSNNFPCTPVQVAQLLPKLAGANVRTGALGSLIVLPGGAAVVQCHKKPPRLVGMDTVPVTQVSISFKGVAPAERAAFIQRLEHAMRSALA